MKEEIKMKDGKLVGLSMPFAAVPDEIHDYWLEKEYWDSYEKHLIKEGRLNPKEEV